MHLGGGSPPSEELAQAMWEGTAQAAGMRRSIGIYRRAVPVPDGASWRARFLGLTGRRV